MSLETGGDGQFGVSTDALADAFYPLYRRLFDENSDFVADFERTLAEARMAETVELYLSRSLAVGVLAGLTLWMVGTLVGYALFALGVVEIGILLGMPLPSEATAELVNTLKIPALIVATGVVFGLIGFGLGFGGMVAIPYARVGERKREINMLLPDAISFMYALSVGGLNQLEILEAMAKAEDTYGEVAKEFQTVVQETKYFDTDYRAAIRNQSMTTPSNELSQFLTDMLSIINSGGDMTAFLDDKKDKHMRTAKQQQEMTLETLELFGEMYMTLSLFPLLLIIILVIMSIMGEAEESMLYGTVYGLIPLTGIGFLVLVSTVKQDEIGDGYLSAADGESSRSEAARSSLLHLGLIEEFVGRFGVFERIKSREGTHVTRTLLKRPHVLFRENPPYVLVLTVPATLVLVGNAMLSGVAPTSLDDLIANPVWGTFVLVYVPVYVNFVPLAIFREWNIRSRRVIINKLSDDLRKLSSANDTGLTLLESIRTVAETSSGKLAEEFEVMYTKVNYGMSLREALVEFNNKYHIPRLARTVKLISKAQEASSQITAVLSTAAQASENTDDIERERISRTRMQVVIIIMTFLTLLAVMAILKMKFVDVMAGLSGQASGGDARMAGGFGGGGGVSEELLSMMFFHAVTMQALLSGFIAGYIRDAKLMSGLKFAIGLVTISLLTFAFI
jgi:flagellar protein FlaJ